MITNRTLPETLLLSLVLILLPPLLGAAHANDNEISQRELLQRLDQNEALVIIDVRRPDEFAAGHVPGATNIPHTEIAARLNELGGDKHKELVVYCESGRRAAIAQGILQQAGFTNVRHLEGDMQSWRKRGLPQVETQPPSRVD